MTRGTAPRVPHEPPVTRRTTVPLQPAFFFQAEDGIRDGRVTGVQTCALPIWAIWPGFAAAWRGNCAIMAAGSPRSAFPTTIGVFYGEIGRASCRERVLIWVVVVSLRTMNHSGWHHLV